MDQLYRVSRAVVVVVPELIDLEAWRKLFRTNAVAPDPRKFTVFSVCRFYPRKRLELLLRAAGRLRDRIPTLEVRIVGNGPEYKKLRQICSDLRLEAFVRWLGHVTMDALAAEYNRADIFCLPSVQEGFGIVFLETMAAGKAIVAARTAAVPEVVRNGILVEPDNAEALAEGIDRLYRDADLREALGSCGVREVQQYEMRRIGKRFLEEAAKVAPALRVAGGSIAAANASSKLQVR